jgi:hypothetical protein
MYETMHVKATGTTKQQNKNSIGAVAAQRTQSNSSQCRPMNGNSITISYQSRKNGDITLMEA